MTKNHIKLLTGSEQRAFNEKYKFTVTDNKIAVSVSGYNRITLHDIDKPFMINSKIRKITFTVEAINLWLMLKDDHSLVDVQQAVNYLIVSYQPVTVKNVLKALDFHLKVKNVVKEN